MDIDARTLVVGVWDWEGDGACRTNSHVASFEDAGRTLVLSHQQPLTPQSESGRTVYKYHILRWGGNSITGVMEDEHRTNRGGEPVAWTLTMFTPNVYRWKRSDWQAGRYTRGVVRCEASAPSQPGSL